MKPEKPFISKSKESFSFVETDTLTKYQNGLISEMNNNLHDQKQKRLFLAEIQRIEKFVKVIQKYS